MNKPIAPEKTTRSYYDPQTNTWHEVDVGTYCEAHRELWEYQSRMSRNGLCACLPENRYRCPEDCANCGYYVWKNQVSLDEHVEGKDGEILDFYNVIPDPNADIVKQFERKELFAAVRREWKKLKPEERMMLVARQKHGDRTKCWEYLNISESLYRHRERKLLKKLRERLKDYYY